MKPPPEPIVINTNSSRTPQRKPWRINVKYFYFHVLFHALMVLSIFPCGATLNSYVNLCMIVHGVPPDHIDRINWLFGLFVGIIATTSMCLLLPISLTFPFIIDKNMKGVIYYLVLTLNGAIHAFIWYAAIVAVTG